MSDAASTMPTTGRWGWYRDHNGDEYRRVSKLLEHLETRPGTYNLRKWDERQVAEGLAIRDDLVLAIKAMGRPDPATGWTREQKDKIDGIARDAKTAAKQRDGARVGTAVHDLTERVDRGEPIDEITRGLPAEPATALRAYEHLLRANGWKVTEIERSVQCEELGNVTGSLDREYVIPELSALLGPGICQHHDAHGVDGPHFGTFFESGHSDELPVIGDVKTEAQPWLNGIHIAPQMAIYSRARKMWRATGGTNIITVGNARGERQIEVPAGEYVPAPCVRQDVAVIVHVHGGRAHPYFVRLDAGWRAAQRAYEQMIDERDAKGAMGTPGAWFAPMPNIVEPKPAELLVAHSVANRVGHLDATPTGGALPGLTMPAASAPQPVQYIGPVPGCDNCAPLVSGASSTRTDGSEATDLCLSCGADPLVAVGQPVTAPAAGQRVEVAVRDEQTGLVHWEPETTVAQANDDNLRKSLVAAIWQADTLQRLSELWQLAQRNGVTWSGPVETAGNARRRMIECPQRALHTGTGKCACTWDSRFPG